MTEHQDCYAFRPLCQDAVNKFDYIGALFPNNRLSDSCFMHLSAIDVA